MVDSQCTVAEVTNWVFEGYEVVGISVCSVSN